jgi:alpha-tubulin suppressor-like RCC1 family protein
MFHPETFGLEKVCAVSAGHCHAIAITRSAVFSWGDGSKGCLGQGHWESLALPTKIDTFTGCALTSVACGPYHTIATHASGRAFAWGNNNRGQLGLGDFRKQHTPSRVMDLTGKMVVKLSCGAFHTACITEDESVYTWGQGGSGRLGHGNEHDISSPTIVQDLVGRGIRSIRCYAEHTMALTVNDEGGESNIFDPASKDRLVDKIKDLEVKLQREVIQREEAVRHAEAQASAIIKAQQHALNLTKQVEALLSERVDLYMKMQSLE